MPGAKETGVTLFSDEVSQDLHADTHIYVYAGIELTQRRIGRWKITRATGAGLQQPPRLIRKRDRLSFSLVSLLDRDLRGGPIFIKPLRGFCIL